MLCDPVTYTGKPPVLATTALEQGNLILLPVAADEDIHSIFELLQQEAAQVWDVGGLLDAFKESLSSIAGSQTAQAFIIKLEGVPVFEIEVLDAKKNFDLHPDFEARQGDYVITLVAGNFDHAAFPVYVSSLALCLDYFFGFPEVQQIVAPLYPSLQEETHDRLFTAAGLSLLLERTQPHEPDLFIISRPL